MINRRMYPHSVTVWTLHHNVANIRPPPCLLSLYLGSLREELVWTGSGGGRLPGTVYPLSFSTLLGPGSKQLLAAQSDTCM